MKTALFVFLIILAMQLQCIKTWAQNSIKCKKGCPLIDGQLFGY
ncbi:MAG: hypothetical protein WC340_02720 [Kiritimatiellia bacterium]